MADGNSELIIYKQKTQLSNWTLFLCIQLHPPTLQKVFNDFSCTTNETKPYMKNLSIISNTSNHIIIAAIVNYIITDSLNLLEALICSIR